MLNRAYLEITNVCNLSCSFCHKTNREGYFLTMEEFDLLTNKLKGKVKYLYLHLMGEPTLHPLLPDFLKIAKNKTFIPIITTNGSLLDKIGDKLLTHPPHKINISLHAPGANPRFSDRAYLDNCISFSRKAAACGVYIAFRLWNLGTVEECENEKIIQRLHTEFPTEWENNRNENGKRLDTKIFLEFAEHFDWPDDSMPEIHSYSDAFCLGLRDQIGILCDGTVVPCCLDSDGKLALGNLFTGKLDEILLSQRAKAIYDGFSCRRAIEPFCRKCGFAKRFRKK